MKLKDFINLHSDCECFYIGADSCFIFIGNQPEFNLLIDKVSYDIFNNISNLEEKAELQLSKRIKSGKPKKEAYSIEAEWESAVRRYEYKKRYDINKINRLWDIIKSWVPITEREVIDFYERPCSQDGMVVIIDGDILGRYWFREEFEKDYGFFLRDIFVGKEIRDAV